MEFTATMSLTYRYFLGDKRVSTAVRTKKGEFLQVFPTKELFPSESLWTEHWDLRFKKEIKTTLDQKTLPQTPMNPQDWTHSPQLFFTAPPGTYYVGDLCYVLSNEVYKDIFGKMGDYQPGLYQKKESTDFFLTTQIWDHTYTDAKGKEFVSDSGTLGITPVSMVSKKTTAGHFYTFSDPVQCIFKPGRLTLLSGYDEIEIL